MEKMEQGLDEYTNWSANTETKKVKPEQDSNGIMRKLAETMQTMPGGKFLLPIVGLTAMLSSGVEAASRKENIAAVEYWMGAQQTQVQMITGLEMGTKKTTAGYVVEKNSQGEVTLPSGTTSNLDLAKKSVYDGGWMSSLYRMDKAQIAATRQEDSKSFRIKMQKLLAKNPALCNLISNCESKFGNMIFGKDGIAKLPVEVTKVDEIGKVSQTKGFPDNMGGTYVFKDITQASLNDDSNAIIREFLSQTNEKGQTLAASLRSLPDEIEGQVIREIVEQGSQDIQFGIAHNNALK